MSEWTIPWTPMPGPVTDADRKYVCDCVAALAGLNPAKLAEVLAAADETCDDRLQTWPHERLRDALAELRKG